MCTDNPLGLMRLGVSSVMGMIMYCAVHPGWRVRVTELDTLLNLNETAMVHARREHGAGPGLLAPESAPWAALRHPVWDGGDGVYREQETEAERESREGHGRG